MCVVEIDMWRELRESDGFDDLDCDQPAEAVETREYDGQDHDVCIVHAAQLDQEAAELAADRAVLAMTQREEFDNPLAASQDLAVDPDDDGFTWRDAMHWVPVLGVVS